MREVNWYMQKLLSVNLKIFFLKEIGIDALFD
jgi:hypothetical protein